VLPVHYAVLLVRHNQHRTGCLPAFCILPSNSQLFACPPTNSSIPSSIKRTLYQALSLEPLLHFRLPLLSTPLQWCVQQFFFVLFQFPVVFQMWVFLKCIESWNSAMEFPLHLRYTSCGWISGISTPTSFEVRNVWRKSGFSHKNFLFDSKKKVETFSLLSYRFRNYTTTMATAHSRKNRQKS
jgi:hypothetical protein